MQQPRQPPAKQSASPLPNYKQDHSKFQFDPSFMSSSNRINDSTLTSIQQQRLGGGGSTFETIQKRQHDFIKPTNDVDEINFDEEPPTNN